MEEKKPVELPSITQEEWDKISEFSLKTEELKAELGLTQGEMVKFGLTLYRKYKMKPELHNIDYKVGKFVKIQ